MIASIVAKEQAMLKMSGSEHNRLSGLSLAQHHTQVIVNGARENLSESPSEISPTSCSPSSSEIVRANRRSNVRGLTNGGGANTGNAHRDDGGDGIILPTTSFFVSPIDVTGLLNNQEASFDMSGILGINSISQMQNAGLGAGTSSDHLFPSASMSTLASLYQSRQDHKGPSGSSNCNSSQLQSPARTSGSSIGNSGRSRHRSSAHDGLIKCHYCPKKWADQTLLSAHMEECRIIRIHECSQCGKRFKARGGLQQHLRIHSNDRPYQCHYCIKKFTQKSHVDQHERIHTGAKPFPCQFCGRAFRQRSQQMGHEATHNSGVLAVATNMANQQQQQQMQEVDSSLGSNGDQNSSANVGGHGSKGRTLGQQQLMGGSGSVSDRLLATAGNGMVAQNAVSSLLALSQSGNMPIQQNQTLADVIASRGGHV